MDPHELLMVATAAGLPNPHVVPWKHHARKTSLQLLWGEADRRWSLLVPSEATGADAANLFRVKTMPAPPPEIPWAPAPEDEVEQYAAVHVAEAPLPPEPMPLPGQPHANRRPNWGIRDLLKRSAAPVSPKEELPPPEDPPPFHPPLLDLDDTMRRRAAKEMVRRTVAEVSKTTSDLQMRYELALQAHNGNVSAIEMFEDEAHTLGKPVAELADQIIKDRRMRERRMMHIHAIQARVLAALDTATGEAISQLEQEAVQEIRGA